MTEKEKPSIFTMIKNFAKDSAEFVKNGAPMCSEEEFKTRMNLCRACPNLTEKDTCGLCGCYMPVKAGWKTTECPDNPKKWYKLIGDTEAQVAMKEFEKNMPEGAPKKSVPSPDMILGKHSKNNLTQIRRQHIINLKGGGDKK
jgi:hypothetical protein